ncbi:hypothetical protein FQA39_LY18177 [Lamprigera yunnana]|nr:hypothetical protein FQA39_LY18177 [Lamprigera yunnana]
MGCITLTLFVCCIANVLAQNVAPPPVVPLEKNENNATNNEKFTEVKLLPFMQLAHGVRSGSITILDPNTFFIENLYYDGKGPDAHFWVGKGSWPSERGILVPDENGSMGPLAAYNGQNVTVKLPAGLNLADLDYLAMWCIKFNHNFGHTYLKKKAPGGSFGVQLEPFKQLAHGLKSGPIVVVDKKTFFVPNLYYDGKGPDAHFWVGKGTAPSATGILVADENGSSKSLSEYTGQNVYITLPHNITVDDIDYFGMWCIKFKHNFGHVLLSKNVTMPPINGNPRYTYNDDEIIRVKKCCPNGQVLLEKGCSDDNQPFNLTIAVHVHNNTHIDDNPLEKIEHVPFVQPIACEHQKYPLDPKEDEFDLLKNGSLIVLNTHQILPMDGYCFETVNLKEKDQDRWITTAILCFSSSASPLSRTIFIIYSVGIFLSAFFLLLTALVFLLVKEVRDARGKCVIVYSTSMAVAFICLITAQLVEIDQSSCTAIAYVIQFFLVSSFAWLTMISCETLCKIIYYNKEEYSHDRKRLYVYIAVGLTFPVLICCTSIGIDLIPDIPSTVLKPQFGRNSCWFDQDKTSSLYFYIPIGIAILINIGLGIAMMLTIYKFQNERSNDISWTTIQEVLKPMYRSCFMLLIVMTISWVTEIISSIFNSSESFWLAFDIINSLQGVIVFVIFVAHRPVNKKLKKLCRKRKRTIVDREPTEENTYFLPEPKRFESIELN